LPAEARAAPQQQTLRGVSWAEPVAPKTASETMAEIGPQIGPAAPPARPVPPSGRPAPKIGGGRLGPGPPPVHQRMGRRSMSVAGDAVMMAAAAAAAAGNRSILSSAVVGRKLRQDATDEKPPSRDSGAAAESPTSQLPGTPADVPEVTGATSDNPEPIAAGGAFVRKGDARGIAADEQQQQEGGSVADHLMECRPLFVPMKSNAQGMVEGHEMEPTVIIKTSFISKLEGQEENMEALKGATSGVNLAKFVQDHRALMLDFFRYEFRKNEDLPAFRRALGLPWYTQLPLALLLLLVLSGTLLLFWIRFEVSLAEDGVEALKVPPPIKPDFSEQVLSVQLDRHFVTPGKQSRSCRCVDWPHDPRVRYHATDVQPVEQNAYMRFHSMMNRTMIHSIELYTEPYSAVANGVSYCARPGVRRNHECEYLPDGASTLQLLWQWSPYARTQPPASHSRFVISRVASDSPLSCFQGRGVARVRCAGGDPGFCGISYGRCRDGIAAACCELRRFWIPCADHVDALFILGRVRGIDTADYNAARAQPSAVNHG
jgi:hypothetical protein